MAVFLWRSCEKYASSSRPEHIHLLLWTSIPNSNGVACGSGQGCRCLCLLHLLKVGFVHFLLGLDECFWFLKRTTLMPRKVSTIVCQVKGSAGVYHLSLWETDLFKLPTRHPLRAGWASERSCSWSSTAPGMQWEADSQERRYWAKEATALIQWLNKSPSWHIQLLEHWVWGSGEKGEWNQKLGAYLTS